MQDIFAEFESLMCRLFEQLEPAEQAELLDALDLGPTPAQVAAVLDGIENEMR